MNWRKGLTRLWLVSSLFWAVVVGWLSWPGDALPEAAEYWQIRLLHPEVSREKSANENSASRERQQAFANVKARFDATRPTCDGPKGTAGARVPTDRDAHIAVVVLDAPIYRGLQECQISDDELSELDKIHNTNFSATGSSALQKLENLELHQPADNVLVRGWAIVTFGPPILLLIAGTSLFWALKGFRAK